MHDLSTIWQSAIDSLEKNHIVDDNIWLDTYFRPATLEEVDEDKVIITTEFDWNKQPILEKKVEIESILSNSFSKPVHIEVMAKGDYQKKVQRTKVHFKDNLRS